MDIEVFGEKGGHELKLLYILYKLKVEAVSLKGKSIRNGVMIREQILFCVVEILVFFYFIDTFLSEKAETFYPPVNFPQCPQ